MHRIAIGVVKEAGAAVVDMPSLIVWPLFPFFLGGCYFPCTLAFHKFHARAMLPGCRLVTLSPSASER